MIYAERPRPQREAVPHAMCVDRDSTPPLADDPTVPVAAGDLTLTAIDDACFGAFAARPPTPNGAGVAILPDLRGLHRFYQALALRLAESGYVTVAIDYYGRTAGVGERGDDFPFMDHAFRLARTALQADLAAAITYLRSPAGGGCRAVFTLGFCMGGRLSFLAATQGHDLAGAIGFYGAPGITGPYRDPGPTQLAEGMRAPILALMGGADAGIPLSEVEAYDAALTAAGVEHEVVVYANAPHGFFDLKHAEFADACADAWRRTLAFIEQHRQSSGRDAPGLG
jgi:carboxymethylenebutenolidase